MRPAKGGAADGNGLQIGTPKANAKKVDLYIDFQCPFCKQLETANGDAILASAKKGEIDLRVHVMTFLDARFGNDSSSKAANAFFCAADAGRPGEFMHALFERQPANEGDGYRAGDFAAAATKAGITGTDAARWEACTNGGMYSNYAEITDKRSSQDAQSTPTLKINGYALTTDDMESLMQDKKSWPEVLKDAQ